jgi:hypothetical protein
VSGELFAASALTLVTGAFAGIVGAQWRARRRPYQAAWLVALAMAAAASASYVLFLLLGRPALLFRLYYLFGAALNVAYLGLGSLYLASRRGLRPLVALLVLASALEAVLLLLAPVDAAQLATASGAGTHVLRDGPWLITLILLNGFGTLCLVGVGLYSAWSSWRRRGAPERALANVVIAAGALTVAAAGTLARLGGAGGFWLTMLAGWIIMFGGFLLANRLAASPRAGGSQPRALSGLARK